MFFILTRRTHHSFSYSDLTNRWRNVSVCIVSVVISSSFLFYFCIFACIASSQHL